MKVKRSELAIGHDLLEQQVNILQARIVELERELRAVTMQLNNHICDRSAPVVIQPYVPPADGTAWPWRPNPKPWTVSAVDAGMA